MQRRIEKGGYKGGECQRPLISSLHPLPLSPTTLSCRLSLLPPPAFIWHLHLHRYPSLPCPLLLWPPLPCPPVTCLMSSLSSCSLPASSKSKIWGEGGGRYGSMAVLRCGGVGEQEASSRSKICMRVRIEVRDAHGKEGAKGRGKARVGPRPAAG